MNLLAIIVHNRPQNIKQWLHCWQQCEQDAKLVIIHNDNGDKYDVPDGVTLITRPNIGFDIGAFQDVCMGRLPGFPEWDNLLWCTDDTLPMAKDFTRLFWEVLKTHAVACMCISPYVRRHIRTTGFAIRRDVAEKLVFPADPITEKEQCYQFEHRSDNTFLAQIERLGLTAIQVAPDKSSPLFDTEYTRRIKPRLKEHYDLFGDATTMVHQDKTMANSDTMATPPPLVTFICPAFNAYPFIIHSLQQQTHTNWKLYLVHDGPNETGLRQQVAVINDSRVHYEETAERSKNWGHSIRSEWLQKAEGDFVVITNQDNYHAPVFIEYMLKGFKPDTVATYCGDMGHSYKAWQIIPCSMRRGYVDCAGVMIRLAQAKQVGWNDITSHSADWFFFEALIKKYGINSFLKVKGCLLIHN
jgi:hypothetical protein